MPFSALDRQRKIYLEGLSGIRSVVSTDSTKLEENAKSCMSPRAFAYIAGGSGSESTMRTNRDSFEAVRIVPRMLRNVEERDTSIELFGKKLPSPFLLAPIGVLELVHPEADLAVAKAAADASLLGHAVQGDRIADSRVPARAKTGADRETSESRRDSDTVRV